MVKKGADRSVRMLLLLGDSYGANCTSDGKKLSIVTKYRGYGWELTLVGVERTVRPCPFAQQRGAEPLRLDCTVEEIGDVTEYDGISVMPGPAHRGLIESPIAMETIRRAADEGLVVGGWCRGVRILAAADVLRGKRVVGHADDRDAIEQAGGRFIGQDHPPIIDGSLVTGARCYYHRAKNAEAIRKAMSDRAARGTR